MHVMFCRPPGTTGKVAKPHAACSPARKHYGIHRVLFTSTYLGQSCRFPHNKGRCVPVLSPAHRTIPCHVTSARTAICVSAYNGPRSPSRAGPRVLQVTLQLTGLLPSLDAHALHRSKGGGRRTCQKLCYQPYATNRHPSHGAKPSPETGKILLEGNKAPPPSLHQKAKCTSYHT